MSFRLIINDSLEKEITTFEENLIRRKNESGENIVLELVVLINPLPEKELTLENLEDFAPYMVQDTIFKIDIIDQDQNIIFSSTTYDSLNQVATKAYFDERPTQNMFFEKILY